MAFGMSRARCARIGWVLPLSGVLLALPAIVAPVPAQSTRTTPNGSHAPATAPAGVAAPVIGGSAPDAAPGSRRPLASFVDSLFKAQMDQHHIPGAAIVLVRDGRVVLQKGYGVSDVRTGRPISADSTLFAVGSLSKIITATAVLQLRDRGLLDLNADVNRYLTRFKLREQFGEPITLHHLLTHTAGFDRRYIGIAAASPDAIVPLEELLATRMPPRVYPPGELYIYSDYGMALAGYLVQLRSGMPYARYVREHVLQPLGMEHSSFEPGANDPGRIAKGYLYEHGSYLARRHAFVNASPAGALVTTVADMGKLLLSQLPGGDWSQRVLVDSSRREMHRRHFAHHPRLPGLAYAYHEDHYYGQRALRHDGWMSGVASVVYLVPDRNIGFFAVFTGENEDEMIWELIKLVHEHDGPVAKVPAPPRSIDGFEQRSASVTGSYRKLQYAASGIEHSANVMLAQRIKVERFDDGRLSVGRRGGKLRLVEVEPDVYEWEDGYGYVTFQRNDGGDVERLFMHQEIYRRLSWYETPAALRRMGLAFFVIFASAPLIWAVAGSVRWYRKRTSPPRAAMVSILVAVLLCVGNVAFMVGIVPAFANTTLQDLALGLPRSLAALLELPRATTLLALAVFAAALMGWSRSFWSVPTRLHYTIVSLAGLAYIPLLLHLGLLSIPFIEWRSVEVVAATEESAPAAAGDSTSVAAVPR